MPVLSGHDGSTMPRVSPSAAQASSGRGEVAVPQLCVSVMRAATGPYGRRSLGSAATGLIADEAGSFPDLSAPLSSPTGASQTGHQR